MSPTGVWMVALPESGQTPWWPSTTSCHPPFPETIKDVGVPLRLKKESGAGVGVDVENSHCEKVVPGRSRTHTGGERSAASAGKLKSLMAAIERATYSFIRGLVYEFRRTNDHVPRSKRKPLTGLKIKDG